MLVYASSGTKGVPKIIVWWFKSYIPYWPPFMSMLVSAAAVWWGRAWRGEYVQDCLWFESAARRAATIRPAHSENKLQWGYIPLVYESLLKNLSMISPSARAAPQGDMIMMPCDILWHLLSCKDQVVPQRFTFAAGGGNVEVTPVALMVVFVWVLEVFKGWAVPIF